MADLLQEIEKYTKCQDTMDGFMACLAAGTAHAGSYTDVAFPESVVISEVDGTCANIEYPCGCSEPISRIVDSLWEGASRMSKIARWALPAALSSHPA